MARKIVEKRLKSPYLRKFEDGLALPDTSESKSIETSSVFLGFLTRSFTEIKSDAGGSSIELFFKVVGQLHALGMLIELDRQLVTSEIL